MNKSVIDVYKCYSTMPSHQFYVVIKEEDNVIDYHIFISLAHKYCMNKTVEITEFYDSTAFYFSNINDAIKFAIFNSGISQVFLNCLKYI